MSYIHQDILRRKKKCMFGKDTEPAPQPQFFSGWVTDSGSSTSAGTWTYTPEYHTIDIAWRDEADDD